MTESGDHRNCIKMKFQQPDSDVAHYRKGSILLKKKQNVFVKSLIKSTI